RRLDLLRPELERNRTAAFFRMEANDALEALPRLYGDFKSLLKPGESALLRTIHTWVTAMVQRGFPGAIIPEQVTIEEVPMLEETVIRWRDEAIEKGRLQGWRETLLEMMTQRFGRLPAAVRRQVEEISSVQELRKLGRKVLRAKSLEEMGLG